MPLLATDGPPFFALLFALAILSLSLAIGRRALLWLGTSGEGTLAERGVVAVAIGVGALQFVPFALGVAGALGIASLRIACGAVALFFARDLIAVVRRAVREVRWHSWDGWLLAWAVALAPALLVSLLLALAPATDSDGLGYHLTVPKRWLQSGSLQYLPTYPYSNAPMGGEMLFAIAMAFAGDAAAKCLHLCLGVLAAAGVYLTGRRLHGKVAGAAATTLFLVLGPAAIVGLLGCAYTEGAIALQMVAAGLAFLVWFERREKGWLRGAALLAGFAVTFKITAALFAVAIGVLIGLALFERARSAAGRSSPTTALAPLWRVLPFLAIPVIPWFIRSALVTGNPFFPLFARWIPSRNFSPASAAAFEEYNRYMLWAGGLGKGWTLAQRKLILLAAGAAVGALGAAAVIGARSWMARAAAAVAASAVIVQMSAVGLYVRYWVPLVSVLAAPAAALLGAVLSARLAPLAVVLVTAIASFDQARRPLGTATYGDLSGLLRTDLGLDSRRAFLLRHQGLYPLYEEVNRHAPGNARVLLYYLCAGFYIDRTTFCAEFVDDAIRFTTWEEFRSDLRRLGVTHVIAPSTLATGGPAPPPDRGSVSAVNRERKNQLVRQLLSGHARLLAAAADQGLYVLDAEGTAMSL